MCRLAWFDTAWKRGNMSSPSIGTPISIPRPEPIKELRLTSAGFGWRLSDDAKRDIEAIEANVRQAEQGAGALLVR